MTPATASVTIRRTMPDIRAAVLKEMKKRGWTAYRMAKELRGRGDDGADIPVQTVYRFLRGDSAINSDHLGTIFDVFGWKLPPKR